MVRVYYPNHWKGKTIRGTIKKLSWWEQTILKTHNAICSNRGSMMPKINQFQEIDMNGATEEGATVTYHFALDWLATPLIEDGAYSIMVLFLKK